LDTILLEIGKEYPLVIILVYILWKKLGNIEALLNQLVGSRQKK